MKTKSEKRREAVERMARSKWEDSKACRKGTRTREQWETWRDSEVARLEAVR